MKYYLIAGEASGDLHGSNLMRAIKANDAQAEFRFYGGGLMAAEGGTLVKHFRTLSYMGFVEVALHLRSIFRNLNACKEDLQSYNPDMVIFIDFPGFNLRVAEFAKNIGIRTCYYISPKIWAWNQKRVHTIKRLIDHMLVILPFEVDFYKKFGYEVNYVGNPLMDAIINYSFDPDFRMKYELEAKKIIAILPGSRAMELKRILPEMLKVVKHFPDYTFIVAAAPGFDLSYYQSFSGIENTRLIFNQTYDILKHADAALVTSGTATLETALFKVPQVVCYKANALSVSIARFLIKIRFISLVNLIVDRKIVTELIQDDCSEQKIKAELGRILSDTSYRKKMEADYSELADKVGEPGASQKAAAFIQGFMK